MPYQELLRFLAPAAADRVRREPVIEALIADAVSRIAQTRGYRLRGSDLLGVRGRHSSHQRVTCIEAPVRHPAGSPRPVRLQTQPQRVPATPFTSRS